MRIEQLYQFIVPLMFLAIWALTSLFSRDAQTLPPRMGRPPDPNGLRPFPRDLSEAGVRETNPAPRPRPSPPQGQSYGNPPRPAPRPESGIRILDSEPGNGNGTIVRRVSAPLSHSRPQPMPERPAERGPTPQTKPRPAKGRTSSLPPRPAEPPPTLRTLSGSLASSMPLSSEYPTALSQLSLGAKSGPLLGTTHDLTTYSEAAVSRPQDIAGPTAAYFRKLLGSPEKVREALVLIDLLGPPVSRRGRHRRL